MFFKDFVLLFSQMGIVPAILLTVGLVLGIVELFLPGFGIFGISGIVSYVAGMIVRMVYHGDASPVNLFVWMLIILIIVTVCFLLVVGRALKKGKLSKTAIVQNDTSVSSGITEGTKDYSALVGKEGVSRTNLRPGGVAVIDNENYDVIADGFFIDSGVKIVVTGVEGVKINVKPVTAEQKAE